MKLSIASHSAQREGVPVPPRRGWVGWYAWRAITNENSIYCQDVYNITHVYKVIDCIHALQVCGTAGNSQYNSMHECGCGGGYSA